MPHALPATALIRRLARADRSLMRRSGRTRSRRLDGGLVSLTGVASHALLWLLIATGLAATGGPRARRASRRGVVAIVLASAIVNGPAKQLVPRRRPRSRLRPLVRMPRSSSFPSGHAASAFAFATAASSELPALAPVLVPLATAVGYSRIHVGVHYPSDVLAGAGIGIALGALSGPLTARLIEPTQ